MTQHAPFWQTLILLLVLTGSLIGLAFHFFPSLKKRARHGLGRVLSHARMPNAARQYAARHLLAQPVSQCGCCTGCSSAPPSDAKITLVPRRNNDGRAQAGHSKPQH